jgi:SPX domain protein involved in polyphosphate accumulation
MDIPIGLHTSYHNHSQLYMYHSRVLKEEGAKLIRIRWYGSSLKKSAIFVERKVCAAQKSAYIVIRVVFVF